MFALWQFFLRPLAAVKRHVRRALDRVATHYWARCGVKKHSILVPIDVLQALVAHKPHLGGAIQQDIGDALQFFGISDITHVPLTQSAESVCANGVVLVHLGVQVLRSSEVTLQVLLDLVLPAETLAGPTPTCLAIAFPTVYERDGLFCYTSCRVTSLDLAVIVGGAAGVPYSHGRFS